MDSTTVKIYSKMFVRGSDRLPAFDAIDISSLTINPLAESALNELISDQGIDLQEIEINEFLKRFKSITFPVANQFIEDAILFYFSHPQVLASLQQGRTTLFPNHQMLPEINYDLLIPVIELDS